MFLHSVKSSIHPLAIFQNGFDISREQSSSLPFSVGLDLLDSFSIILEVFQETAVITTWVPSTMFLYVSCKHLLYQA